MSRRASFHPIADAAAAEWASAHLDAPLMLPIDNDRARLFVWLLSGGRIIGGWRGQALRLFGEHIEHGQGRLAAQLRKRRLGSRLVFRARLERVAQHVEHQLALPAIAPGHGLGEEEADHVSQRLDTATEGRDFRILHVASRLWRRMTARVGAGR